MWGQSYRDFCKRRLGRGSEGAHVRSNFDGLYRLVVYFIKSYMLLSRIYAIRGIIYSHDQISVS